MEFSDLRENGKAQSMTALPPCDYRVDTADVHRYFCQHPLVIAQLRGPGDRVSVVPFPGDPSG